MQFDLTLGVIVESDVPDAVWEAEIELIFALAPAIRATLEASKLPVRLVGLHSTPLTPQKLC